MKKPKKKRKWLPLVVCDKVYDLVDRKRGMKFFCRKCSHQVNVVGTDRSQEIQALHFMRKQCPRHEQNFYQVFKDEPKSPAKDAVTTGFRQGQRNVWCAVTEQDVQAVDGTLIPGLVIRCLDCDTAVEVKGQSDKARQRGLKLLNRECPWQENNCYVCTTFSK